MPNWCSTDIVIYSRFKNDIEEIHDIISSIIKGEKQIPYPFNPDEKYQHIASNWIGNISLYFQKDKKLQPTDCRGWITFIDEDIYSFDLPYGGKMYYFEISSEDAFDPQLGPWKEIINCKKYKNHVYFEFMAFEPGMGLFQKTDKMGIFFPETFLIDGYIPKRYINDKSEFKDIDPEVFCYFDTFDELLDFLNSRYDFIFKSIKDINKFKEMVNDEGDDYYLYFNIIELIEGTDYQLFI